MPPEVVPNDHFELGLHLLSRPGLNFRFPDVLVEEMEDYITRRDSNGVLVSQGSDHPLLWLSTTGSRMPGTGRR